jgi:hypothetical protein
VPNGIPCGLQSCIQFVQGTTKRWKIKCSNTQHILCSVCPKFLVEFGVRNWWTYELWLIIDGIINGPCSVQTFFCLYWMCAVWCVETGDASWNMEVTYSAWMRRGRRLVVTGQTRLSVLIRPPADLVIDGNVLSKLSCLRCDCDIRGIFFMGVIRKCLCGDPGAVSVSLFCPVESGFYIDLMMTQ